MTLGTLAAMSDDTLVSQPAVAAWQQPPGLTPKAVSGEKLHHPSGRYPDPAAHAVVRWHRFDLQSLIEEHFGVVYHERMVDNLRKHLGFSHANALPYDPKQDAAK